MSRSPKSRSISTLDLTEDALNRLSHILRRTEEGSDLAIIAPIFGDKTPEDVLEGWDKVIIPKVGTLRATLQEMESSNRSKFGPRSLAKPWVERKDSILESFDQREIDTSHLDAIVEAITDQEKHRLRPLDVHQAAKFLQPNTNSGLPHLTRKKLVLDEVVSDHQAFLNREDPSVLFTRTQEQRKTRDVWGQPVASVLEEMAFFQVLLPFRKRRPYRSALNGPDHVERRVGTLLDSVRTDDMVVSIDFSSYDASISPSLSRLALSKLLGAFQTSSFSRIEAVIERFVAGGIVTPDGVLEGLHGVPSGSGFTNEVDSVVQLILACSVLGPEHRFKCDIQGDDGVHVVPENMVESLYEGFKSHGLVVNEDKSHLAHDECVYLQNYFHKEDRLPDGSAKGVYPSYRALNRIVHPERWTDLDKDLTGQDFFAIRTISILENCKRHPFFEDLVKYVASIADLNFTSAGHDEYIDRIASKGKAGILHAHGEAVRGIYSFETMKVLRG